MERFHRGDGILLCAACLVLTCYSGLAGALSFVFNEALWFAVGAVVWMEAVTTEGMQPRKRVKDNIRLLVHTINSVGAAWWGCVVSGFTLALMAHAIPKLWLRIVVNSVLAGGVYAAGVSKFRSKKEWAEMENDPPLWVLAVCVIS